MASSGSVEVNLDSEEGGDPELVDISSAKCQVGTGTVSPRYRDRVLKVSGRYRSHGVNYLPGQHNTLRNALVLTRFSQRCIKRRIGAA